MRRSAATLLVLSLLLSAAMVSAGHLGVGSMATQGFRQPIYSDHVSSSQNGTLFNSQATGAANTAVTATVTATANEQGHLYRLDARCSAGSASLTVESPSGTTIWSSLATEVGTTRFSVAWNPGLSGAANVAVIVTLGTCGVANTGTLTVQADRY
jgi:hypothetical protein